ncbi:TetR/AcrR family transcriptional regulator [Thalassobacillus sp. CUG 92003]|uniref:TetR/AcrR family transcriptional regulator n=1 Tax=Thalassobacillus sp. CUG 92003 TaxID=2736641 RepID=UPI0015E77214|nr:TetR/AcrR family transcriptional regulator [Thalassobacillus sp. CUG 92003]
MKQQIINTSIHLFDKKGFTETSVQEIVDALGVTKGTFYYYFTNKEVLLRDIHLEYIGYLLQEQEAIMNDETKDSKAKLHDVMYLLIHSIHQRRKSARIFFREMRNLGAQYLEQSMAQRDLFRRNVQSIVEEGMRNGQFKADLNPDMITRGILGVTNWSYYWFNPEGEVSDKELTSMYLEMILNGINT